MNEAEEFIKKVDFVSFSPYLFLLSFVGIYFYTLLRKLGESLFKKYFLST